MGLPLFITPVEPDMASKANDKAVSGPRSSIRRPRSMRSPRVDTENRRRRLLAEYDVWASQRQQRSPPTETDVASVASLHTRAHRMFEDERLRLRDTLSFERQRVTGSEPDGPLMPPVPESRDFTGVDDRQREIQRLYQVRQDLRRMARRHAAPTSPYTENDISAVAINTDSPRLSSVTPALSPLRQAAVSDTEPRRRDEEDEFAPSQWVPDGSTRSMTADRLPPINRLGHRTISMFERARRRVGQPRLDGLGDRDRSLSPEGEAVWDTLLTSITPDPQPPSVGSSFASSSAAAAASSSSSLPASTSTSMTSLGRTEEDPTIHECDISDSGSNTEEEEEEDIYELHDFSRGRGDRSWRRTYAGVAARADRLGRQNVAGDTEHLGGMHRIISRLAERDDIPDEWWAGAGLSRNLPREPTS